MTTPFDPNAAKKFLKERDAQERSNQEEIRKALLEHTIAVLKEEFPGDEVQAFLVGSILRPNQFTKISDVDIVIKNFHGDRFALWSRLEAKIGRQVEIILFEQCSFKEFVESDGLKVV